MKFIFDFSMVKTEGRAVDKMVIETCKYLLAFSLIVMFSTAISLLPETIQMVGKIIQISITGTWCNSESLLHKLEKSMQWLLFPCPFSQYVVQEGSYGRLLQCQLFSLFHKWVWTWGLWTVHGVSWSRFSKTGGSLWPILRNRRQPETTEVKQSSYFLFGIKSHLFIFPLKRRREQYSAWTLAKGLTRHVLL